MTDNNTHIARPSLRDAICERLNLAILKGELKGGQRLTEVDLAQWLGVSRGVVREAIREMENTGLVVNIPYRGTFVKPWTAKRVREIHSVRALMEEYAIEQAIHNITDEDIDTLQELVANMHRTAQNDNYIGFVEHDLAFHRKIYAIAGNSLLSDIVDDLNSQSHKFAVVTETIYMIIPSLAAMANEHMSILDAIKNKDIPSAKQEISAHIINIGQALAEILQQKEDEDQDNSNPLNNEQEALFKIGTASPP